jgi:dihydrofolate synthase/folylpolyglutamate synthase
MADISPVAVLQEWLDSYLNFEKLPQKNIFWLDTMQFLCQRFNHPESCAPSFHVAGSKGKGSISVMIASILEEAGYTTGLYTSPHILNFAERIGTAHGTFSDDIYESAVKQLMNSVDSIIPEELPGQRPVTWFELVTMFAFLCFKEAHVQQAVYEVGLGGRLDATNVITPKVCCIGPIELEHTEYLGDTVEKIAVEKGGIIKSGIPVIISPQKESVRAVFKSIADIRNAPLLFTNDILSDVKSMYIYQKPANKSLQNNTISPVFEYPSECGMNITLSFKNHESTSPFVSFKRPICTTLHLLGEFQAYNAAAAAIAVKTAYPSISEEIIERGLSHAFLPGRFEIVHPVANSPLLPALILDGAHTVNSVKFTMDTFHALFEKADTKAQLLFACAADKDIEYIAPLFKNSFSRITLTRPGSVKQSDMSKLTKAFSNAGMMFEADEDFCRAIKKALSFAEAAGEPLLVTGSFYLVAEVKKIIAGI